ncbi:hypothetical protein GGX14DRAFT_398108 [Mycena pura]|uniref:Uncharacterized protein n=1 Tax=Mycena pura TaxID=153505 RepID=A0AAD6YE05_9AGAR|nr:hypothetical protein GGX14DRAFT_398108 [Mycena pura]
MEVAAVRMRTSALRNASARAADLCWLWSLALDFGIPVGPAGWRKPGLVFSRDGRDRRRRGRRASGASTARWEGRPAVREPRESRAASGRQPLAPAPPLSLASRGLRAEAGGPPSVLKGPGSLRHPPPLSLASRELQEGGGWRWVPRASASLERRRGEQQARIDPQATRPSPIPASRGAPVGAQAVAGAAPRSGCGRPESRGAGWGRSQRAPVSAQRPHRPMRARRAGRGGPQRPPGPRRAHRESRAAHQGPRLGSGCRGQTSLGGGRSGARQPRLACPRLTLARRVMGRRAAGQLIPYGAGSSGLDFIYRQTRISLERSGVA